MQLTEKTKSFTHNALWEWMEAIASWISPEWINRNWIRQHQSFRQVKQIHTRLEDINDSFWDQTK